MEDFGKGIVKFTLCAVVAWYTVKVTSDVVDVIFGD